MNRTETLAKIKELTILRDQVPKTGPDINVNYGESNGAREHMVRFPTDEERNRVDSYDRQINELRSQLLSEAPAQTETVNNSGRKQITSEQLQALRETSNKNAAAAAASIIMD